MMMPVEEEKKSDDGIGIGGVVASSSPGGCADTTDDTTTNNGGGGIRRQKNMRRHLDRWPEDCSLRAVDDDGGHTTASAARRQQGRRSNSSFNCRRAYEFCSRMYEQWTYSYMSAVLNTGASRRRKRRVGDINATTTTMEGDSSTKAEAAEEEGLSASDLYVVPRSMRSIELIAKFEESFQRSANNTTTNTTSTYRRLLRALWTIASPSFIPAGFCELFVVICGTALPLLIRGLIRVVESNPHLPIVRIGLPWAISIFGVSVINGLANHRHRHLSTKAGAAMRGALINAIYVRSLKLSPDGKVGLTSGEVANLMAVDAQKLYEVTQEGHLIWALPLSVLLVSFFLYQTLGPSSLVGVAVLIGFVPIVERVMAGMMKFRTQRVALTDSRVELVASMLRGIRVTKLNNQGEGYLHRISEIRNQELVFLRREMAVWATTLLIMVTSPVLATAATFTTYVLINGGENILTTSDAFGVLILLSALRFPINFAGRMMGKVAQAISAARRIASFLDREIRLKQDDDHDDSIDDNDDTSMLAPLTLSSAAFRVGGVGSAGFEVSDFDFTVNRGEVIAVCGPVGCGKSTLINGILGDAQYIGKSDSVKITGRVAYVPQTPFVLNLTVRENILFGRPYDQEWYDRVLDACCLRPDLEQLGEAGDATEIGERGVTLSGGQKQRISLARAAYAKSSLVVLDDPFSALDAGTGSLVFDRLIGSADGLFSNSAVLLVTHASYLVTNRAVSRILLIVDGKNCLLGTWEELQKYQPDDERVMRAVDHIRLSVREEDDNQKDVGCDQDSKTTREEKDGLSKKGRLIQTETREHGLSSMRTWLLWFKRAGGLYFFLLQMSFMVIDRIAYVAVEFFLAAWTSGAYKTVTYIGVEFPPQSDGLSAQAKYLKYYWIIILVSAIATGLRSEWGVTGGGRAARNVFNNMLVSVLRAPMSYFESVPMGRILNRFTYDTDINDVNLTQVMSVLMISLSWYVAGVVIQVSILPYSALVIFPLSLIYYALMKHYRLSGPDLQRLDALSRSPLQSMVTEGMEGSATIRVFCQEKNFINKFRLHADENCSAVLNFMSAQRWLAIRMELLGSTVVLVSGVLVVCLNEVLRLDAGLIGILIIWSCHFTITLNFVCDNFSEAEAAITAIERVDAMADLPREQAMKSDDANKPPQSWPKEGVLEFKDVSLRYREGLPLVLNNLSFKIPAGKTCGVVGRTGTGKSSLAVALFRLVEIESGHILLDGIDLGKLGLSDVRGRGMAIIPQDPFLAGATIRDCLDPFGQHGDAEIMDALSSVRLGDDESMMYMPLEEGGSNFSVGECQLLNLARSLLSQPKLLFLDEATASIDGETDTFIQKMLRTRFSNTTIITIAHRLNTIMDYDVILVMDAGRAVEFGTPSDLLDMQGGVFSDLVDATGAESSRALRALAKQSVEHVQT